MHSIDGVVVCEVKKKLFSYHVFFCFSVPVEFGLERFTGEEFAFKMNVPSMRGELCALFLVVGYLFFPFEV